MPRSPLIRQGEGHHAYQRITQERIQERNAYLKIVARIQAELIQEDEQQNGKRNAKQIGYRSSEGDQRRLRAIPVIAPAVAGTIPGTNPEQAIIAAEDKRLRSDR